MRVCSSFEYVAEKFGCPKHIVELGVRTGDNALGILKKYPSVESIVLVDPYIESIDEKEGLIKQIAHGANLKQMIIAILPFGDKVTFYPTTSIIASKKVPDNYFDYIYLDDDRTYEVYKEGISKWYKKVRLGGFLAGHDFDQKRVQKVIFEFLNEKNLTLVNIPKDYSIEHKRIPDWLVRKK